LISTNDTVLDLGCGIGAAALTIAPWCKSVIALDNDKDALGYLENRAKELGISNITTKHSNWPDDAPLEVDVVIALHVYQVMHSPHNLKPVLESAKRCGLIACHAPVFRRDESFVELKEELGITPYYELCDNGCYTKGALDALGARTSCKKAVYNFSQPLDSLDEVARFIAWQINARDSMAEIITKRAHRYVIKENDKYLVPVTRHSCLITFKK